MRSALTRIGNSRGVRIPKPLIEQCGLGDIVELRVTSEGLVIAPHRAPRHGWKKGFSSAPRADAEMLLDSLAPNEFDNAEWKW
jgi:antitoxin MazE